jgi:DNA-binding MarR family transcriptional regulator
MRKERTAQKGAAEADYGDTPCNNLALRQAARHVSQMYDRHMARVGLRGTQYSILSKLHRLGPMPLGKLAETLVIERTALSRAIGPLERDGLVAVGAGANGRTRQVALTAAGEAKFKAALAQWRKAQKKFEAAFGVREAEALRSTLRRVLTADRRG